MHRTPVRFPAVYRNSALPASRQRTRIHHALLPARTSSYAAGPTASIHHSGASYRRRRVWPWNRAPPATDPALLLTSAAHPLPSRMHPASGAQRSSKRQRAPTRCVHFRSVHHSGMALVSQVLPSRRRWQLLTTPEQASPTVVPRVPVRRGSRLAYFVLCVRAAKAWRRRRRRRGRRHLRTARRAALTPSASCRRPWRASRRTRG